MARKAPRWRVALIVLAIVLAVLASGGFVAYRLYGREIRRLVMGPRKSYLQVESANLKGGIEALAGGVATIASQADVQAMGVEANVSLKLPSLPGMSPDLLKAINGLKLKMTAQFDRKSEFQTYVREDLLTGNDPLLGIELFVSEDQKIIVGLPGLIEPYIELPASTFPEMGEVLPGFEDMTPYRFKETLEPMPPVDKAQLAASLGKLSDVFLAHIDDATFADKVPMTAGSVTATYECYTVTAGGRQLRDMAVAMIGLARDEKPIRDLLYPNMRNVLYSGLGGFPPMVNTAPDSAGNWGPTGKPITEAEWTQLLNRSIDALKALKDEDLKDLTFTQRVYLDKQDRVHGREITVVKASGQMQSFALTFLKPVNGSQNGLRIGLSAYSLDAAENFDVQLTSQYESKDGFLTGTADIVSSGKTALSTTFRRLGYQKAGKDAYLTGEADLALDVKAFGNGSSSGFGNGSGIEMDIPKLTIKADVRNSRYWLDIAAVNLGSVSIDMAMIDAASVKIPPLNGKKLIQADDEEAMSELMSMDMEMKVLEILEKLGIDPMSLF